MKQSVVKDIQEAISKQKSFLEKVLQRTELPCDETPFFSLQAFQNLTIPDGKFCTKLFTLKSDYQTTMEMGTVTKVTVFFCYAVFYLELQFRSGSEIEIVGVVDNTGKWHPVRR